MLRRTPELLDRLARTLCGSVAADCEVPAALAAQVASVAGALHEVADSTLGTSSSSEEVRAAALELQERIVALSLTDADAWHAGELPADADGRAPLGVWDAEEAARRVVRRQAAVLMDLGEPPMQVEHLFSRELLALFGQARCLRARERRYRADERLAAWRHAVEAQALFVLVAPLVLPLAPALCASIEHSLANGDAPAASGGQATSHDELQKLCDLLATCAGGYRDAFGASATPALAGKRAVQMTILGMNPNFVHLPPLFGGEDDDVPAAVRFGRDRYLRQRLSEEPAGQPLRDRGLQGRFVRNWSAIVDGEWFAIKRERWGVLELVCGLDDGGCLACDDCDHPFTLGADAVRGILRDAAERQRALRAIERDVLLDASLADRALEAFRAAALDGEVQAGPCLLGAERSLRWLPVWQDGAQTRALLDACRAYLVDRSFDANVVDALFEDIGEHLVRFRFADWGTADDEFADALSELICAFAWSPMKALDLRQDHLTVDAMGDALADEMFAPLTDRCPLVLSLVTLGRDARSPRLTVVAPMAVPRHGMALRCVMGRQSAEAAIDGSILAVREEQPDGSVRFVERSPFDEQMHVRLEAVRRACAAASGWLVAPAADDAVGVRTAEEWRAAGGAWILLPAYGSVSGVHAAIAQAGGAWWCLDAGSHNGTVVVRAVGRAAEASCATARLFCMEGRARQDGSRGGRKLFERTSRRLQAAGYQVELEPAQAVRLEYGDVIILGEAKVKVAWL